MTHLITYCPRHPVQLDWMVEIIFYKLSISAEIANLPSTQRTVEQIFIVERRPFINQDKSNVCDSHSGSNSQTH